MLFELPTVSRMAETLKQALAGGHTSGNAADAGGRTGRSCDVVCAAAVVVWSRWSRAMRYTTFRFALRMKGDLDREALSKKHCGMIVKTS